MESIPSISPIEPMVMSLISSHPSQILKFLEFNDELKSALRKFLKYFLLCYYFGNKAEHDDKNDNMESCGLVIEKSDNILGLHEDSESEQDTTFDSTHYLRMKKIFKLVECEFYSFRRAQVYARLLKIQTRKVICSICSLNKISQTQIYSYEQILMFDTFLNKVMQLDDLYTRRCVQAQKLAKNIMIIYGFVPKQSNFFWNLSWSEYGFDEEQVSYVYFPETE